VVNGKKQNRTPPLIESDRTTETAVICASGVEETDEQNSHRGDDRDGLA